MSTRSMEAVCKATNATVQKIIARFRATMYTAIGTAHEGLTGKASFAKSEVPQHREGRVGCFAMPMPF